MNMNTRQFLAAGILLTLLLCGACDGPHRLPGNIFSLANPEISSQKLRQRIQEVLFEIMATGKPALQCHALETLALFDIIGKMWRRGSHPVRPT